MNLMHESLSFFRSRGNEAAIINQAGVRVSFNDFHDHTTKLAYLLSQRGLNKNSKVVLLAALDWPLYCTIAACFQLGATVVLVDPWASSKYIEDALSQVNPEFLIISKKARLFYLKSSIRKISNKILLDDLLANNSNERLLKVTEVEPDHTALITFTSGTTGKPKGFDRSHLFLGAQQNAHDKYFDHHAGEIDLSMYPVFVLSNLKSGMCSVLIKGNLRKIDTIKSHELYEQLTHYKVDSISVSPVILEKLITYCEENKRLLPLKKVFTGGAPVRRDICERLLKINPEIQGYVVYGSTEAEPIALVTMKEVADNSQDKKTGTPLGRIVDALTYELLPINEPVHPYHQGVVGEVALTGDYVGKKYWNNEAAFHENKWIDKLGRIWHKTGDIVIEKDKFLHMIGRRSNPIRTTDGLLYPVPIEDQLDAMDGITKAAYLHLDTKIILAFSGDAQMKGKIQEFLTSHNLPVDNITHVSEMPMDARHRSKIDLAQLKKYLSQGSQMNLTQQSPLAHRLLAYTKERFPLVPIMVFVFLLTSGYAHFFANWFGHPFNWGESKLWVTMVCVFLFMLQLRMADEIKDFDKDSKAFPERLLSRGVISLHTIRIILYSTITVELLLSFSLGSSSLMWMVILQVWGNLMAKEFFCKKFLDEQVAISLILHQLILIPLAIYSALPFIGDENVFANTSIYPALLYSTLIYTVYELARKTWSADRENENADSYTRFWGIKGAVITQMIIVAIILATMERLVIAVPTVYQIIAFVLGLLHVGVLVGFKMKPTRKMSKMVETTGSVLLLGICALNAFAL